MKIGRRTTTVIEPGTLRRPKTGLIWKSKDSPLPLQYLPAWQSNGGLDRNNPDRSKPFSLEILPPSVHGLLARIHVIGVFALHAAEEQPGTMGASITVGEDRDPVAKIELINGRHYSDAYDLRCVGRLTGDGASIETVGATTINDKKCRVDLLTIDVMKESTLKPIRIRDFGTPASFVIYDLFYEFSPIASCPFKTRSGGVALSELAAVVRVGDRVTLRSALDQLEAALQKSGDLDEAKGEALTFLAVVTAAMLEMGGPRSMHRIQLESARKLDSLKTIDQVITETRTIVENTVSILTGTLGSPSAILVDRALSILNRNFAKNLTDGSVAEQLNLSTSHFRYLFKEVTGQPFHKYLIALRLERARKLLLEANMPVSEVAAAVGFNGLAHFSRAFAQRFAVSPTNLRRSGVTVPE